MGALLLVVGCDKLAQAVADKAGEAAGAAAEAGLDEDDKLGEKLNGYIHCINYTAPRVNDSAARYFSWADAKAGVTGEEKHIYGLFDISDQAMCLDGIAKSADLEPDDTELEAAAAAFATALREAQPIVSEAHKYYDEEDYKDDKFAKAKELHPKLVAAFEKFAAADQPFRDIVAAKSDALAERSLAKIEKEEGRKLPFQNKNVMAKAKALVSVCDVPDLEKLDIAAVEAALKNYEAAVDEATKYVENNKAEADSVMMFSGFIDAAAELRKATKALMRRKRDNEAYTKTEIMHLANGNDSLVEGSPGSVLEGYNELVGDSNRLSWNFYKPNGEES